MEIKIEAHFLIEALENQRNTALADNAKLYAQLKTAEIKIASLGKQLEENTKVSNV